MLSLRHSPAFLTKRLEFTQISGKRNSIVLCAAKGPRPRYPRVWKSKTRIGTVSKSLKLVETIKSLSNVKEEVYGALDSFIAWDLEFPLITVKKALKALENEKEWKRIIQVTKWMLSKGQGRTMGSYLALLNALAEDERIEEAEELWAKVFSENLEALPRTFYDKMISIYYNRDMHDKMFEIFADMEELGVRPSISIVSMVGNVFQKLGMIDKYEKLHKKYPPPTWEIRYIKGKRVKIRVKATAEADKSHKHLKGSSPEPNKQLNEFNESNEHLNKIDSEEYNLSDEFEEDYKSHKHPLGSDEPDKQLRESNVESNNHLNKVEASSLQNEVEEDDKSDNL